MMKSIEINSFWAAIIVVVFMIILSLIFWIVSLYYCTRFGLPGLTYWEFIGFVALVKFMVYMGH